MLPTIATAFLIALFAGLWGVYVGMSNSTCNACGHNNWLDGPCR